MHRSNHLDRHPQTHSVAPVAAGALVLEIPFLPPTVNHMYALNRNGSRRLTDEAISFRSRAGYAAKEAAQLSGWQYPQGARLAMTVRLTFGTKRKSDIANREKALTDAIAPVLGFDDEVIDRLVIERAPVVPGKPACVIVLEVLE